MKKFSPFLSVAILFALLTMLNTSVRAADSFRQPATGTPPVTSIVLTQSPTTTAPPADSGVNEVDEPSGPRPTRTPRPTGTPIPVPPPSDPDTNSMLIGLGIIAALVVLFGVWVNRSARV